jgi:hypothetical protein
MGVGAVLIATAASAQPAQFEVPMNRLASEILTRDQISGPHHRVRQEVVSYGYLHHYTVDSDFGTFDATGDMALRKLLKEIVAIAALREIKASEAFGRAVKDAAKAPLRFGENLIKNPTDTLSGLPSGVFQVFENVGAAMKSEPDPSEDSRLKQALFVSSWKRDFAADYGVDVYSSNKVLQEELNSVGWAAAIGGLSVSAITAPAGGTGVVVLKQMRFADQIGNAIKEEPPSRLRISNEAKLKEMGLGDESIKRFLDHPALTPRHDTIITNALYQMNGAAGRDTFIDGLQSVDNEVAANFYQQIAETMWGYHASVSPVTKISIVGGMVVAQSQSGAALVPFALDHGVWSQRASQVTQNLIATYQAAGFSGKFDLWVTGTVSPLAQRKLTELGFSVSQQVGRRILFMD